MTQPQSLELFRNEIVAWLRGLQDEICGALESVELASGGSNCRFREDQWDREGGGGGRSRVLEGGAVFEKAGVNFSEVHGEMEAQYAGQLPGQGTSFYATGVSLVIHPRNPYVPTCHANFRYLEKGDARWFGGGADLTPYYYESDDRDHFHSVWKNVCDRHSDVANYDRFSRWCDRYFYLPHRGERRGVGGIFFDYLGFEADDKVGAQRRLDFVKDAGNAFVSAYLPIVKRRLDRAFGPEEQKWQQIRRGRYVEFNLVYDRGTIFGLKTNGRTESILMSLPPHVQWIYDHEPAAGTPEAKLLEQLRQAPPPPENEHSHE